MNEKELQQEVEQLPVVVLSGPSGSGKTTIVERLINECPVKLVKCISATTRPPRKNEKHGEDYYFLTAEEFERLRKEGAFVECAEVHGKGFWYGTLKSELERAKKEGGVPLLEIDVQGAMKVMESYPDALSIFLTTPSEEEYERRLRKRGTESEEAIQRRLQTARKELQYADRYKYRVVNDVLDRAVREIVELIVNWRSNKDA